MLRGGRAGRAIHVVENGYKKERHEDEEQDLTAIPTPWWLVHEKTRVNKERNSEEEHT